jgi:Leucine-rich repeat (LRR) protein
LRSEGLSAVSEALKSTSIKQLNIAENNLTYNNLTYNISENYLTNRLTHNQKGRADMSGVIKFAKDVKDMGSLSRLDLSKNEIGAYAKYGDDKCPWVAAPEGSQAIVEIITSTPNLNELNISNNQLSGAQYQAKIKEICAGKSIKCAL